MLVKSFVAWPTAELKEVQCDRILNLPENVTKSCISVTKADEKWFVQDWNEVVSAGEQLMYQPNEKTHT